VRKLYWWLVVPFYWGIVVYFLRAASPVSIDGGGPEASFYWSRMPMPSLGEYYRRKLYFDSIYWVP